MKEQKLNGSIKANEVFLLLGKDKWDESEQRMILGYLENGDTSLLQQLFFEEFQRSDLPCPSDNLAEIDKRLKKIKKIIDFKRNNS